MSSHLLWVPQASTIAPRVDHIFEYILGVSVFFALGIAAIIVVFCIRYRRHDGSRNALPHGRYQTLIELTWIGIPFGLCLVMFFWGADIYVQGATFPPDADDVLVVAKQWMWKIQHAEGQREIDELHVPLGRDIRLVMTSQDVIHSFYVPEFRVKMDVLPGRYTFLWFEATKVGTFHLFCAQYCGTQHSRMRGKVVVMEPDDYARWMAARGSLKSSADLGAELFVNHGCVACHKSEESHRAPPLDGLFGTNVVLIDGRAVLADENYIREKILNPNAKVPAGYAQIMPSFKDSLTDEEVFNLVEYVKSLGRSPVAPGGNRLLDGETR